MLPERQKAAVLAKLEPQDVEWPSAGNCLALVFASRSGSTFVTSEIIARYDVGEMREAFTPGVFNRLGLPKPGADWFAFKAGVPGLVVAEALGFPYWDRTKVIRLLRRDLVAQAVSAAKAKQSGLYHSVIHGPPKRMVYDAELIARITGQIVRSVDTLTTFAARFPSGTVFYEDAVADAGVIERVCDGFGVPRRSGGPAPRVERMADQVSADWIARFRIEMPPAAGALEDRYRRSLSSAAGG